MRQVQFAEQYRKRNLTDLNDLLVTYVDLKYDAIWSEDFCKRKKWEFKEQSLYFRLVKQGSVLVYLTFHVFTCLVVLLMAVLRQSFVSLGYVLILLPRMKDGSEVLRQRLLHQGESKNLKEQEVKSLETKIEKIEEQKKKAKTLPTNFDEAAHEMDKEDLAARRAELANMKKESSNKSLAQKQDEKVDMSEKQWKMIKVVRVYLMAYACLDFACQIIAQLPIITGSESLVIIGFRKVWRDTATIGYLTKPIKLNSFDYNVLINSAGDGTYHGL